MKVLIAQLCLTLCNPNDCSPPGSSVHGILQARILEWVAILVFRGSFWPEDRTWVSCIAGRFFTIWVTREALDYLGGSQIQWQVLLIYKRRRFNTDRREGYMITEQRLQWCDHKSREANSHQKLEEVRHRFFPRDLELGVGLLWFHWVCPSETDFQLLASRTRKD